MQVRRIHRLAALALVVQAAASWAQTAPPAISRVTLYPSGATVERELKIAAGTQKVEIDCLPAGFDEASLRVEGDADLRTGDIATDRLDGVRAEACRRSPLDERIRQLEDQRAAVQTERDANDLAIAWLKQLSTATPGQGHGAAMPDARALAATSDALRHNAQDAYARQLKLTHTMEDIDKALAPLRAERDRAGGRRAEWRAVRFVAQSAHASTLRLVYEVARAGWTPTYRASLDSAARTVLLERQAQIAQATGEDWHGVHLTLSTGQPARELSGPTPQTWSVDIAPPPGAAEAKASFAPPAMMAPAPMEPAAGNRMDANQPMFDVSVFEGSFATQFDLPGASDLASDGQKVTVNLQHTSLPVQLLVRATPRDDERAFLVAQAARPQGVWLRGPVQLRRDGTLVGTTPWNPAEGDQLSLPFGIDDLVQVSAEGERHFAESTGFFGGRVERRMAVSYVVHNRHRTPVQLELLEASPVAASSQIEVKTSFTPQPATDHWHDLAGVAAWEQTLAPDQTARFSVQYGVSYPKDARVVGLP